jgi:hypothetical protein
MNKFTDMHKTITIVIVFLIGVAGCQHPLIDDVLPDLPDGEYIWIAKHFIGGKACDPNDRYSPPDITLILARRGIEVYKTDIEHHAVCRACGCPTYSATHYALIARKDVQKAIRIGFEIRSPYSEYGK